jgi:hypothetical protein
MYRHCLFCQADLERNEIVEALPIGRRLAFDEAKGRLWVICRKCERWNLTPFDSRWEAIEECERQFRGTKMRVSTDNIGLARIAEGLELVRIGAPLRPEMAAWRYGDQFGRRRKRHMLMVGGAVAGIGALAAGLAALGIGIGGFAGVWGNAYQGIVDRAGRVKIPTVDGRLVYLVPSKARKARVWFDPHEQRLALSVRVGRQIERWYDDDARAIASTLLPRANIAGAGKGDVQRAVELIGSTDLAGDPLTGMLGRHRLVAGTPLVLKSLSTPQRLALEMALHEEQERRALQGELKELELRWQAAEEIANIADSLTLPASVEQQFADLKRRAK